MMNKKKVVIITIGLLFLILSSGCLQSAKRKVSDPYCKKVETAFLEDGKNCTCRESKIAPKELKNMSITSKCRCFCLINGTERNFNVIRSGGINKTKVIK